MTLCLFRRNPGRRHSAHNHLCSQPAGISRRNTPIPVSGDCNGWFCPGINSLVESCRIERHDRVTEAEPTQSAKTLQELRVEVQLFNEQHGDAFRGESGLKRCAAVGRDFEVVKVNSHTKFYSLKSNADRQECFDGAKFSLNQRQTEAVDFAEEVKELVRKWEKLQLTRSSRKGQLRGRNGRGDLVLASRVEIVQDGR